MRLKGRIQRHPARDDRNPIEMAAGFIDGLVRGRAAIRLTEQRHTQQYGSDNGHNKLHGYLLAPMFEKRRPGNYAGGSTAERVESQKCICNSSVMLPQ